MSPEGQKILNLLLEERRWTSNDWTEDHILKWNEEGSQKAAEQFRRYLETDEPYLYGRNNVYLNMSYAEEERCRLKLQHSWVPTEVWQFANQVFGKLKSYANK